jgi:hypothetical protein
MSNLQYAMLVIGLVLLTGGCDRSEWTLPKTKAPEQTSPAADTNQDNTPKDAFLKSTREELDRLKQELDALKEKTKTASEATKERMKSEIEDFQVQQQALETKWNNWREEGSANWKEMEKSFRDAIENLRTSIHGASTNESA